MWTLACPKCGTNVEAIPSGSLISFTLSIEPTNCPGCGRDIFLTLIRKGAQIVGFQVATDSRFSNQDETLSLNCPNCAGAVRVHAFSQDAGCRLVLPPASYECGCGMALYLQAEQTGQRILGIRLNAQDPHPWTVEQILNSVG